MSIAAALYSEGREQQILGGDIGDMAAPDHGMRSAVVCVDGKFEFLPSPVLPKLQEAGGSMSLRVASKEARASMTGRQCLTGVAVGGAAACAVCNWRLRASTLLIRTAAMDFTMPYSEPSGPQ